MMRCHHKCTSTFHYNFRDDICHRFKVNSLIYIFAPGFRSPTQKDNFNEVTNQLVNFSSPYTQLIFSISYCRHPVFTRLGS